jgi:hypothetical protein
LFVYLQLCDFQVGWYGTAYPGYRRLTWVEWQLPVVAANLLACHTTHGGFPLLQAPLQIDRQVLHLAEGHPYHGFRHRLTSTALFTKPPTRFATTR